MANDNGKGLHFNLDLARAYLEGEDASNDAAVLASYEAFKRDTLAQFADMVDRHGIKVTFGADAYSGQSSAMFADLDSNKHLGVYAESDVEAWHPLAGGYNLCFRATHDFYGHYGNEWSMNRYSFGRQGEEQAFQRHARMYSSEARLALTLETRAQAACNLWLNDTRHGGSYAPQRLVNLPARFLSIDSDAPEGDK